MTLVFVYLPLFERTAVGVLTDEDMQRVEQQLLANPRSGVVVRHTGGVRKLRAAQPGRGKSGSARVVYCYIEMRAKIYFLLVYAKNEKGTLTEREKVHIQGLVQRLKEEE